MKVYSIFNSIDGEVNLYGQGRFTTFIRLAGCNLDCAWCDTKYAKDGDSGKWMSLNGILVEVGKHPCQKITITGGEPLIQHSKLAILIKALWHRGYAITLETNGSIPLIGLTGVASFIVDYKTPSSGMHTHMMDQRSFSGLTANDYIKFVIEDRHDYAYAKDLLHKWRGLGRINATVAFSPVIRGQRHERHEINRLFGWLKRDLGWFNRICTVMLNIQLHKVINLDEPD